MEKTLVILIGNARGGEKTWQTMYKNLLDPYNADLALCFGYNKEKKSSLYSSADYIWEIPEYEHWEDFYYENFGDGPWQTVFKVVGNNGFSGLFDTIGSSGITLAMRHYIFKNKRDIVCSYDRIIISRSDYFYVKPHPILINNFYWIPYGEGYGGITDRHIIFPSSYFDIFFGIVQNYVNTEQILEDFKDCFDTLNIEKCYSIYLKRIGYSKNIRQFQRVNFTVKTKEDPTRWWAGDGKTVPYNENLYLKYSSEYDDCMKNIFLSDKFETASPNIF